jgi:hypothetical protein
MALKKSQLYSSLWQSCDELRGGMDASQYKDKGFSFWHVISEAPDRQNRNEGDRIPDLRRCERIRWIAQAIQHASNGTDGFIWWESQRKSEVRVVIWAEPWDFVVILAKRREYYLLKTAFCELKPHRRRTFEREREAYWRSQKG